MLNMTIMATPEISHDAELLIKTKEVIVDEKKKLNFFSYLVGSLYGIGQSIFENFFQYLAIMLGSAGILQGLITSIRQLGNALLSPFWGRLSDKFGRRRFLVFGNLLLSVIAIIIPNSPSVEFLLFILVIYTIINTMVLPTWTGYLGDMTYFHVQKRGSIIGKMGMVITLVGNIAILFVAFFMDKADHTRTEISVLFIPFYIGAIVYFLAAINAFRIPTLTNRKRPIGSFFDTKLELPPTFKRLLIIEGLFTLCWAAAWPLFPYVIFNVTTTWWDIGLLAFAMALFASISNFYGGKLVDRFGKKKVILYARFFFIFPPILFVISAQTGLVWVIFLSNFVVGGMLGASTIAITTLILDSAPQDSRSTYQALFTMVTGIMAFLGSIIMGILLQLLTGNVQPSIAIISILLLGVSVARFISWLGYRFLIEPEIKVVLA